MKINKITSSFDGIAFENQCKGGLYLVFILYSLYQLMIFLSWTTMSPDEISFIAGAKVYSFFDRSAPPLNYGTLFWVVLGIIKSPLVLRFFFLILFLSIPLLILSTIRSQSTKLICFLFYLTMPYAFWTGKLISPEVIVLFLIALSLHSLSKRKFYLAALLAGLAVGVKTTAIPFLIFFMALQLYKCDFKKLLFSIGIACLGIWIANPINVDLYFLQLSSAQVETQNLIPLNPERIKEILFIPQWSWDMLLTNAFSQLIINPYCILVISILLLIKDKSVGIAFTIFWISSLTLVYFSRDFLAWYFFPFIPVLMYCIGDLLPTQKRMIEGPNTSISNENMTKDILSYSNLAIVVLITIFNFYTNIEHSIFQASEKFSQIKSRRNFQSACIENAIKEYQPQQLINKSDRDIDAQILSKGTIVRGAFGSSLDPNIRSMAIISTRLLKNPYHFDTLVQNGQSFKKYKACGDTIIITSTQ